MCSRSRTDIIIKQIESATLIQTLTMDYDDQGYNAMEYIKSAFSAGTDRNKLEVNHEKYRAAVIQKLPEDMDVEQFRTVVNEAKHITLTQTRYIEGLFESLCDVKTKFEKTPAELDLLLTVVQAREAGIVDEELRSKYREIVGAILYVAMVSRPDVSLAVGLLGAANNNARK